MAPTPKELPNKTTAVIIGTGVSGMVAAISLQTKLNMTDYIIVEKKTSGRWGGVWDSNTYPGAACDVLGHVYCFSTDPNPDWSAKWPAQAEIQNYFDRVAIKYNLPSHAYFGREVINGTWNPTANNWILQLKQGDKTYTVTTKIVISGVGQLSVPKNPDIKGLDTFKGKMIHSAKWDHSVDMRGKKVAVLGTGASLIRQAMELYFSFTRWLSVHDPVLRKKLTPDYPLGCKRVLLSDDWYSTVQRPNVDLITNPISHVTELGVVTVDPASTKKTEIEVDVLVLGTGFAATDFLYGMDFVGLNGVSLQKDVWGKEGAKAYHGYAVSGFPNLFILYGPNTNLGHHSIILMIEATMNEITSHVSTLLSQEKPYINVKKEAQDAQFQAAIAAAASAQYHNNQTAAAAAAVAAASGQNRTVYLGGLPATATYEEVMSNVRFGAIEQVKLLEEKNCAFITFIESAAAMAYVADAQARRITIGGQEVKVGWGKPSHCSSTILAAVQSGATRNVFIGNLDESLPESVLVTELSRFGPIDQIKILAEKKIAFIHMTSVAAAMKAVSSLPNEPRFAGRRVNYGKDRCGGYGIAAAAAVAAAASAAPSMSPRDGNMNGQMPNPQNRTVYLGGIHPDVTTKDICDVVRGGILHNIKYMPDKNIAFVSFIDPNAALAFFNRGNTEGVVIKGKRVKVGWGKPSPLPLSVSSVVQTGASRNVYIGNLDATVTEERLRKDFGDYGEIELVNILHDKSIAFVSFTDISSAVKAVESVRSLPEYAHFKINYGKDRCGNLPRSSNNNSMEGVNGPGSHPSTGQSNTMVGSLNASSASVATAAAVAAAAVAAAAQNMRTPGGPNSPTNIPPHMVGGPAVVAGGMHGGPGASGLMIANVGTAPPNGLNGSGGANLDGGLIGVPDGAHFVDGQQWMA
ncbi:hypothetical protein HDV05_006162 [Chytridiales sp. JEL 0842]|nr:hypothetical protein HDV05_006162 [Chytridiales sp. JEL 0842]